MTVFLGDSGTVKLARKGSDVALYTEITTADVDLTRNRFSVDFAHEQIITGDRIEIVTTGDDAKKDLDWIAHPDADDAFTRYVHIDAAGGIRLYDTFGESLEGKKDNAIPLAAPAATQQIRLKIKDDNIENCLAEVTEYQITTSRETIDTTHLGAHYIKQYESGLIQGQGTIDCFWSGPGGNCDDRADGADQEFASYLARLCIRLVHGAAFHGFFYIYTGDRRTDRSVWYEAESCIVTNVAVTVSPTQVIQATINFVTNGPIVLREGYLPGFILQEDDDFLLQENSGKISLEIPDI